MGNGNGHNNNNSEDKEKEKQLQYQANPKDFAPLSLLDRYGSIVSLNQYCPQLPVLSIWCGKLLLQKSSSHRKWLQKTLPVIVIEGYQSIFDIDVTVLCAVCCVCRRLCR